MQETLNLFLKNSAEIIKIKVIQRDYTSQTSSKKLLLVIVGNK